MSSSFLPTATSEGHAETSSSSAEPALKRQRRTEVDDRFQDQSTSADAPPDAPPRNEKDDQILSLQKLVESLKKENKRLNNELDKRMEEIGKYEHLLGSGYYNLDTTKVLRFRMNPCFERIHGVEGGKGEGGKDESGKETGSSAKVSEGAAEGAGKDQGNVDGKDRAAGSDETKPEVTEGKTEGKDGIDGIENVADKDESKKAAEAQKAASHASLELQLLKAKQERLQKALAIQTEKYRQGINDLLGWRIKMGSENKWKISNRLLFPELGELIIQETPGVVDEITGEVGETTFSILGSTSATSGSSQGWVGAGDWIEYLKQQEEGWYLLTECGSIPGMLGSVLSGRVKELG